MAFVSRNPVGFVFKFFAGSKRLDYTLLRFTSLGTVVYITYYVIRIL